MVILALSDIHGETEALAGVLPALREADLVLVAGDITDFGDAEELEMALQQLGDVRERLVAVPGNCDRKAARERLDVLGLSADGRLVERSGVLVAGVGGGIMRTGLTPYERRDEDLAASLRSSLALAAARLRRGQPLVVLSHQPPKGSGADERRSMAVGSRALREILDVEGPPLWICGHIHESPCARRAGRCLVVNPGPAKEGRYALVRLDRSNGSWIASAELRG
jgi:Icc-related predicted phosphoesterase